MNSPVDTSSSATPTTAVSGARGCGPDARSDADGSAASANQPTGATAIRNAGSRASRYPPSVKVPGLITRTTSRRTSPVALRGSSTCSQIATRKPFLTRRVR